MLSELKGGRVNERCGGGRVLSDLEGGSVMEGCDSGAEVWSRLSWRVEV